MEDVSLSIIIYSYMNAPSSKTHTHYTTGGSRQRMHEADEAAADCAKERTLGHERKNHGGAAHAVVTAIF